MSPTCIEVSARSTDRFPLRRDNLGSIAYRQARSIALGPCMRLMFEDELTVGYQVAEVLRAEGMTSQAAVQRELEAYAHLLPDGSNWKATLMIELPDAHERQLRLPCLNLAAHGLYIDVAGHSRVIALANEDLADRHVARPSAVHFLRFPLPRAAREALQGGADAVLGCGSCHYPFAAPIPGLTLEQLRRDFSRPPTARPRLGEPT